MNRLVLTICSLLLLGSGFFASASAETFSFGFSNPALPGELTGEGQVTATYVGLNGSDPQYLVTAISGTTAGQTITELLPPNTYDSNSNNLYFYSDLGEYFPGSGGIGYQTASGADFDLYYIDSPGFGGYLGYYSDLYQSGVTSRLTSVDFADTSAVPEPASLTLFALGALGLSGLLWNRGPGLSLRSPRI
jgi:PEP-CTERM motif